MSLKEGFSNRAMNIMFRPGLRSKLVYNFGYMAIKKIEYDTWMATMFDAQGKVMVEYMYDRCIFDLDHVELKLGSSLCANIEYPMYVTEVVQ